MDRSGSQRGAVDLYRVDAQGVTEFGPDHGRTNDRVESLFADEEGGCGWARRTHGLFRYA